MIIFFSDKVMISGTKMMISLSHGTFCFFIIPPYIDASIIILESLILSTSRHLHHLYAWATTTISYHYIYKRYHIIKLHIPVHAIHMSVYVVYTSNITIIDYQFLYIYICYHHTIPLHIIPNCYTNKIMDTLYCFIFY